jgi:hypothetical protein
MMTESLSSILREDNVVIESKPMGWKTMYLMINGKYYYFHHCNGHHVNDEISCIVNEREICRYMLGEIEIDIDDLLHLE